MSQTDQRMEAEAEKYQRDYFMSDRPKTYDEIKTAVIHGWQKCAEVKDAEMAKLRTSYIKGLLAEIAAKDAEIERLKAEVQEHFDNYQDLGKRHLEETKAKDEEIKRLTLELAHECELSKSYWDGFKQQQAEIKRLRGEVDCVKSHDREIIKMRDTRIAVLEEALKEIAKPTYGTEWITMDLEEYKSNHEIISRHYFSAQELARLALRKSP